MQFVLTEQIGQVALVTIDNPAALNALNTRLLEELSDAFAALDAESVRCVVLTGSGEKAFVAGADIAEMKDKTPAEALAYSKKGNDLFLRIENYPAPVIAAINGFALGGGCELCMACDIRIAAQNAKFGQPEVGLGITPGFGGTQRLARLVGPGLAKELLYTAKRIDAARALETGLVNRVVPPEELMAAAMEMANAIAANAPVAVQATKQAVNRGLALNMAEAVALEEELFASCFATEDQKAAMAAFVAKEKPGPFKGK